MRGYAVVFVISLFSSLQPAVGRDQEQRSYWLPFPVGDSARLIQGNNGRWGHEGHAAFAFDFVMPIGSPVTAAGSGQVVAVEERYTDGTGTPGEENFVVIRHADSTFTRYYHPTAGCFEWGCQTIAVRFVNVGDALTEGEIYRALPAEP